MPLELLVLYDWDNSWDFYHSRRRVLIAFETLISDCTTMFKDLLIMLEVSWLYLEAFESNQ